MSNMCANKKTNKNSNIKKQDPFLLDLSHNNMELCTHLRLLQKSKFVVPAKLIVSCLWAKDFGYGLWLCVGAVGATGVLAKIKEL